MFDEYVDGDGQASNHKRKLQPEVQNEEENMNAVPRAMRNNEEVRRSGSFRPSVGCFASAWKQLLLTWFSRLNLETIKSNPSIIISSLIINNKRTSLCFWASSCLHPSFSCSSVLRRTLSFPTDLAGNRKMARINTFIALLVTLFHLGDAFVAQKPSFGIQSQIFAGMAQPETKVETKTKVKTSSKQKVELKKKFKTDDPVQKRENDFEDAPMFKLLLLADDGYDVEHVVTRMCAIVDDLDEDAAATVFQQAQQEGKAMCGKYPYERAELFKEQLLRSDPMIFADLEDENA